MKVNKASYYHWIKAGCIIKKVDEKRPFNLEVQRYS